MKRNIRLYSISSHDRSTKAQWLLTEMGVDYNVVKLSREKKENESPAYLKLNPMGRVPTVEIDDVSFYESGAICTYLADLYSGKGLAPAPAAPDRGKYLQWMFFASATIEPIQTRIMIVEDIPAGEVRVAKEAALVSDLRDAMEALNHPLAKGPFLLGDTFTAADICVGHHLYFLTLWPELKVVIDDFPKITAYLTELKRRPAAIKTKAMVYED